MEIIVAPQAPWHLLITGLVALATFVLLVYGALKAWRPLARKPLARALILAFSLAAGAALGAASWNPILRFPTPQPSFLTVLALDVSDSTLRDQQTWKQSLQRLGSYVGGLADSVSTAQQLSATATILTFGQDVQLAASGFSRPDAIPLADLQAALARLTPNDFANSSETNVEAALREASRRIAEAGGRGIVILVSDGQQTQGNALAAAKVLSNQGIPVYVFPLSGTGTATAITAAYLPSYLQAGTASYLRAVIRTTGGETAYTLTVSRNTGLAADTGRLSNAEAVTGNVTAAPANTGAETTWPYLRYPIAFTGRGLQYADLILNNPNGQVQQYRRLYTYVDAPQQLLAIGGDNQWISLVPTDLAAIVPVSPDQLETVNLSDYDGVVISGLPANRLPESFIATLAGAVEKAGLRVWLINGDHGDADEKQATVIMSYDETPLGPLLPVAASTKDKQPPARQVIVIIDTSGSMQGWPLAKAKQITAHIASDLLRDQDSLEIIAFSDQAFDVLSPNVMLMTPENKQRALTAIANIPVGGGTYPDTAIKLLAQQHANLNNCGLIFISDGEFGDASWVAQRPDCRAMVLKIGGGGDTSAISLLADPFTVYEDTNPNDIQLTYFQPRAIFFDKDSFQPLVADDQAGVQVIDSSIQGWAITQAVEDAQVPIVVQKYADPVLATRAAGLGQVTALTTGIPPEWLATASGQAALRSWFHYAFPDDQRGRYLIQATDSGTQLALQVSVVDPNTGQPAELARLSVWLETADQPPSAPVWLEPDSTQLTFVGVLTTKRADQATPAFLMIQESGSDALRQAQRIPIVIPPVGTLSSQLTQETFSEGTNAELLQAIATQTRGAYGTDPHFVLTGPSQPDRDIELWPWLVIVAAFCYWPAFALPRMGL